MWMRYMDAASCDNSETILLTNLGKLVCYLLTNQEYYVFCRFVNHFSNIYSITI